MSEKAIVSKPSDLSSGMPPGGKQERRSFSRGRRWSSRAHVVLASFLVVYCVLVFNIIVYRHPARFDLTEEALFSLSDDTLAKLRLVKEEIRVLVPYHYQPDNPQHVTDARVLQRTLDLLKEINARQPLVQLVEKVNVFSEPDRWKSICQEYGLAESQWNRVIFVAGRGNAHKRALTTNELADIEAPRDVSIPGTIRTFRGEQAVIGAIVQLTQRERKRVYFTQGHGEPALRGSGAMLSAVASDLESSGYEPRELELLREGGVPRDASVVIIAGPSHPFSQKEIELLEKYLLDDGRLLVTLGPERTGIEELLEGWGVRVLEGRLAEGHHLPGQEITRDWVRISDLNPGQAITSPFRDSATFGMLFRNPRPLRAVPGQRTHLSEPLLATTKSTESSRILLRGGNERDLVSEEREGSFAVAVAVFASKLDRPPPGWVDRKSRLVVVGAANFLHDYSAQSAVLGGYRQIASHRPFLMNSIHWLADQEDLLSRGGEESLRRSLPPLDASLKRFLFITSVLIFPGVFACLGIGIYFWRRT